MLDLFKDYNLDSRPFLVLGKGKSFRPPSVSERVEYNTIALNHAVRETQVTFGHIIDVDVLDQLGDKLRTNCDYILMPYYPHMGWRPHTFLTLEDLCKKHPILSKMQDRVYGYNLSTAANMINKKWNDSQLVWASFFSAEAVVNLLAKLGCKTIRTLGVDGGKGQAEAFKDLQNINTNGYDAEWKGIRKSIQKWSLDYSHLGIECPIRIFIGAGNEQIIPALVLKHSILKHATMSVDVTIMNEWTHPMPKDKRNWPRTPFSFQRFMIPEKCGYKGHAIYMDSDMLVYSDVKEIWNIQSDYGTVSMRGPDNDKHRAQNSVLWISCEDVRWNIEEIVQALDNNSLSYEELVFELKVNPPYRFSGSHSHDSDWNSLEEYTEGKTKLLHYTEMWRQPWRAENHPLGYLWFNELKEAVDDGSIDRKLVEEHVVNGWILPKCLEVINDSLPQMV